MRSRSSTARLASFAAVLGSFSLLGSPKADAIPLQSVDTGNHYEYITAVGIGWLDAKLAAEEILFSFDGREYTGYLATITSAAENTFVKSLVPELPYPYVWLGATDEILEGDWRWVTGPEGSELGGGGRPFWSGDDSSGSPVDGSFEDWQPGEPNDFNGEDYLQMIGGAKSWNDNIGNADFVTGFVVEFHTAPEPNGIALLGAAGLATLVLRARRRPAR